MKPVATSYLGNSMSNQQAKCICISDFHETLPSVKLLSHTYFGCLKLCGFGAISHTFFQHFGHLAPCS